MVQILEEQGFSIIGRNLYTRFGEIDIIATEKKTRKTLIIEVKTRRGQHSGKPESAITWRKIQHMKRAVHELRLKQGLRIQGVPEFACAAVYWQNNTAHIRLYRNINNSST